MNRKILPYLLVLALALAACGSPTPTPWPAPSLPASPAETLAPTAEATPARTPLVVFAAGSLIIPFDALEQAFEARYPAIDILAEYHGSIQVIRHATELHKPIDVIATADASLIPMLMYAATLPETSQPYANWYIRFATNRLALAFQPQSVYAEEISETNWPEILARPEVRTGIADPRFDPSGYRALMAFALAEASAGRYTYFGPMFADQFTTPLSIFRDDDLTTITVPEVLETKPGAHILLRGASIQLIALLQAGELDYAFEYASVIQQHNLELLPLPAAVNLGEPGYAQAYQQVQVTLDFRRFTSIKPEFRGEQIGYGVTIPASAPHPEAAALFITFLLGEEGRAIMAANYHPLFSQPLADGFANLPAALQVLCIEQPK